MIGENGPDAPGDVPGRGPSGRVEWNLVTQAANMGWPYCIGNNVPYNDFNFATSTPGPAFDCTNLVNDSPNNTGLANLPPSQPAVVWYGITSSSEFPEVNTAQGFGSSSPAAARSSTTIPGLFPTSSSRPTTTVCRSSSSGAGACSGSCASTEAGTSTS